MASMYLPVSLVYSRVELTFWDRLAPARLRPSCSETSRASHVATVFSSDLAFIITTLC